ncbi:hypothetical protein SAMN06273572_10247 [Monaibacterium marinum]|uniref:Uncharacterized protein n=1 Tax=Pontivivens marinum TaxID=1690039 RepID=A0A2C9CPC5_9RHOB|nr:hypothetical protein [Monaibacterium marinum]SOH93371.1 hypothetical protein SAMN06273572_10247 [Monaibacterium marinum]
MSKTKSYKVLRSCVAADGASIAKGGSVLLDAEQAVLWQQAGKIGASAPTSVPTLISEPVSPPVTTPAVKTDSKAPSRE